MSKGGMTLLEILIAILLISFAILPLFQLTRAAQRETGDASLEFLAFSLAREPIEIFKGVGFKGTLPMARAGRSGFPDLPLGEKVIEDRPFSPFQHPAEAGWFKRSISLEEVERAGVRAILVTSVVSPADPRKGGRVLSRGEVVATALLVEQPE
jgi:type II secretory pathway pseudopilin PulG